jgi:hypothetical protein
MANSLVNTSTANGGIVGFAGSRHGSVPEATALVSVLASQGVSFLVGCAPASINLSVRHSYRSHLAVPSTAPFRLAPANTLSPGSRQFVGSVPLLLPLRHFTGAPSAWLPTAPISCSSRITRALAPGVGAPAYRFVRQCSSTSESSSLLPFLRLAHGVPASSQRRSAAWSPATWWCRLTRRLLMQRNNVPRIRIAPVDNSSDRFLAAFTSEALNATFSVVFRENVSGAVALHSFAEMIRSHYDVVPELTVVDSLPSNIAVTDMLKSLERPLVAGVSQL